VAADLDPGSVGLGPERSAKDVVTTNRDKGSDRRLILTSRQEAWAWAVRVNADPATKPVNGCQGQRVAAWPFCYVQLPPPAAGLDAEWFVIAFLERREAETHPPEAERVLAALQAVCKGRRRASLIQATDRQREANLQAELATDLSHALGREVRVAVRHWAVE
jgi:hypothetical protein